MTNSESSQSYQEVSQRLPSSRVRRFAKTAGYMLVPAALITGGVAYLGYQLQPRSVTITVDCPPGEKGAVDVYLKQRIGQYETGGKFMGPSSSSHGSTATFTGEVGKEITDILPSGDCDGYISGSGGKWKHDNPLKYHPSDEKGRWVPIHPGQNTLEMACIDEPNRRDPDNPDNPTLYGSCELITPGYTLEPSSENTPPASPIASLGSFIVISAKQPEEYEVA